eukprot:1160564-Pelagomonas_calceolata.AAC.12
MQPLASNVKAVAETTQQEAAMFACFTRTIAVFTHALPPTHSSISFHASLASTTSSEPLLLELSYLCKIPVPDELFFTCCLQLAAMAVAGACKHTFDHDWAYEQITVRMLTGCRFLKLAASTITHATVFLFMGLLSSLSPPEVQADHITVLINSRPLSSDRLSSLPPSQ